MYSATLRGAEFVRRSAVGHGSEEGVLALDSVTVQHVDGSDPRTDRRPFRDGCGNGSRRVGVSNAVPLLRSSFQHLPGISASKERRLWSEGVLDWMDLLRRGPVQLDLYRRRGGELQCAVEASEQALASGDISYFASRLPKRELYRVAASFPERCTFLDIESTGLSTHYDRITLVGWSVGSTYTALIDPDRVSQLLHDLREYPIVVTFNGSLFDLPFLAKRFRMDWSDVFHVDLRYLAKRVGLTGGQKKIEDEIGITREGSLQELDGAGAVSLWFDYKEGDLEALRKLVRYNHADIEGMKYLFEDVVRRMVLPVDTHVSNGGLFRRSRVCFSDSHGADGASVVPIGPYRGAVGPRLKLTDLTREAPRLRDIAVVGIDLTGSERRRSGWAVATGHRLAMDLVGSDDDLIQRTIATEPFLVSIDSPLSLPAGRVSEFDDDPGRDKYGIVREAERQLRKRGIHVYPALLPSMQRLTRRGVELATSLRSRGIPVIECYPGAAQDILGIPRKKTSLKHLLEGLRRFGYAGLPHGADISHDELDAATSALVGQFAIAGYWEALGSVEEDYLIVPTTNRRPSDLRPAIVVGLSGPIAAGKTTAARILERMGFQYCRFSEIIAHELQERGIPITRTALQMSGEETHGSRFGQRRLQNKLAACAGQASKIVVDGLRHPEDRAFLRERWGLAALHVHVDANLERRARRYSAGTTETEDAFRLAQAHAVERNVPVLEGLADRVVSNEGSVQELEARLRNVVEQSSCR